MKTTFPEVAILKKEPPPSYFHQLLTVDFATAKKLVKRHGSPLLVLSLKKIKENFLALQRALPRVKIYYAIKANPHEPILKILKRNGAYFEIASFGEAQKIKKINYPLSQSLHTNPIKKPRDIAACRRAGINWFVFDNLAEIQKIASEAPRANVLLRLSFSNRECQVDLSYKFGASLKEAADLIKKATEAGLRVRGLHFHVGSEMYSTKNLVKAIKASRRIFDKAARQDIAYLDILDIGGGYPVPYLWPTPTIYKFCAPVRYWLDKLFPSTEIWAEPGRFIPGTAVTLITQVVGKSIRRGLPWYYLDDGVYNSFSGRIFDHCDYRYLTERSGGKLYSSVLAGPTCDSFDIIKSKILLPNLSIGDIILIPSMGAYTNVSATNYNGFKPTKIICV